MKPYLLEREQRVRRPLDEVFPFFSRPENLEKITPPLLGMSVLTPSPIEMRVGALIDYSINMRGLPMRWTTYIAEYDPPHRFVDVQLRGPYSFWHHTHTFHEDGNNTILRDEVRYLLPFGPLGRIMHRLLVQRDLNNIFAYRQEVIAREFPDS
jgi:hypothetical protein